MLLQHLKANEETQQQTGREHRQAKSGCEAWKWKPGVQAQFSAVKASW